MKKRALVLAGGGTRGIYQLGVLEALREINEYRFDIITGTSVGALNALMLVQHDFEAMQDMYEHLEADQIINGFVPSDMNVTSLFRERDQLIPSFKTWLNQHGVDIRPLEEMVHKYYHEDRFFSSEIEFGCIAATMRGHDPVYVTKEMMKDGTAEDWLIASASAFPVFPAREINGVEYVDGGYFDNFPVDFALRLGAEEIIAIDLSFEPRHPNYLGRKNVIYIHPHEELFKFLDFDKEKMRHARRIGYLDAMKAFGRLQGENYAFAPFEMPKWFDAWYRDVLLLETRIKLANGINGQLRSSQYVTDKIKMMYHVSKLTDEQYLYGMMDTLMELCGCDNEKVYEYYEARNWVLANFAAAADENYMMMPSGITDIPAYIHTLDIKGVIMKMIHSSLYPQHSIISEDVVLTLYPFEKAAADFVSYAMKELLEE